METKDNYIPVELLSFLSSDKGYSLIIKGPPGSGKTTLALQILDFMGEKIKPIYLSTRLGDKSLHKQFPWLKDTESRIKILISSEIFLSEIYKEEEEKGIKIAAKKVLREMNRERPREVSRSFFNEYFKEKKAPEISLVYKEIEMNLPNKVVLVIDSLEGITIKYGIKESDFTYMIQKDLVESNDVTAIFVSEKQYPMPEDYVVDSEINLNYEIDKGKRFRTIKINKLRGKKILQSSYPFTIYNGIFKAIYPINVENNDVGKWETRKDRNGLFSTGIEELDFEMNGGIKPGSFVNIEVSNIIPLEILRIIQNPFILNSFSQNKGVFLVPAPGTPFEFFKAYYKRWIPENTIESNLFYIDYEASTSKAPNHLALGGKNPNESSKLHIQAISDFMHKKERVLFILHHDSLEYIYGKDLAMKNIFSNISNLRMSNSIAISVTKPGQKINQEISNISDYLFKLISKENGIFLYGIKPKTIYYAIEIDPVKKFPNIKARPMI